MRSPVDAVVPHTVGIGGLGNGVEPAGAEHAANHEGWILEKGVGGEENPVLQYHFARVDEALKSVIKLIISKADISLCLKGISVKLRYKLLGEVW